MHQLMPTYAHPTALPASTHLPDANGSTQKKRKNKNIKAKMPMYLKSLTAIWVILFDYLIKLR